MQAGMVLLGAIICQRIALLAGAAFLATELPDGTGELPLLLCKSHRVHLSSLVERPLAARRSAPPMVVTIMGRFVSNGKREASTWSTWLIAAVASKSAV